MRSDAGYWIAWSKVGGVGAARLRRLWEHFGDLGLAWSAGSADLQRAGLDARTVAAAPTCGATMLYPTEHYGVTKDIVAQGAMISEFPLGAEPDGPNVPMRDRDAAASAPSGG